jgi:hypothetical protein
VRRCQISLASPATLSVLDQAIAALNTQQAGRGEAIRPWVMGGRIITSTAGFTLTDNSMAGGFAVAAGTSYDCPAVNWLAESRATGGGTAIVEVLYTGDPQVP